MKRIKAMNGYTIMQVTARDEKQGNGTAGEFAIFFSSDIRDYGVAYSTPEYDGIDSLEVCEELIAGDKTALAKEALEQEYTAVTMEMIEEKAAEMELDEFAGLQALVTVEEIESKKARRRFIEESEGCLERNSTPTRWEQYKNGKIDRATANEYATNRAGREVEKWTASKRAKIEEAKNAAAPVSVSVSVEWKKSRTWGMNPTASVIVEDKAGHIYRGSGYASGCGYDKESAAVASALNGSASLKRMLYTKKEKALSTIEHTGKTNESNEKFIAYGAGYGAIPYFEGGVGMSSLERVFNACGLRLMNQSHGKTFDVYYFEEVAR